MAFKMAATNGSNKQYLFPKTDAGVAIRDWEYVTLDTALTVDTSGYITAGSSDGDAAIGMLQVGDRIWSNQVTSIDDDQTIEEDMESGIVDVSLHIVLENTGLLVNLSNDLLGVTVADTD